MTAAHPELQTRACDVCSTIFPQRNSMQRVCSPRCAITLASANRKASNLLEREAKRQARAERRETKRRLEAIKPRSKWLAEAQAAFNAYVRARDAHRPCISCGRFHGGQWHAGHYLTVGARPELRFDEANVHKQCQPCNTHLHGNLVLYRRALLERVGAAEVDRLEGPTPPKHYSVDDLREIRDTYRAKARTITKILEEEVPA